MKKIYLDATTLTGCIGVIVNDAEVIWAGATVYSMPVKCKNEEYQRYAEEYDIHFIFDDNIPQIDFYTIPQVDIMAVDSRGGYIGTIGEPCDIRGDTPICYIDHNRKCFLIGKNGQDFLQKVSTWQNNLEPHEGVVFYESKEAAMKVNEFLNYT